MNWQDFSSAVNIEPNFCVAAAESPSPNNLILTRTHGFCRCWILWPILYSKRWLAKSKNGLAVADYIRRSNQPSHFQALPAWRWGVTLFDEAIEDLKLCAWNQILLMGILIRPWHIWWLVITRTLAVVCRWVPLCSKRNFDKPLWLGDHHWLENNIIA